MLWLLKQIGGPGFVPFFLVCCLIGLLLRWWRPAWARVIGWSLAALSSAYLVLSLPVLATRIAGALPSVTSAVRPESPGVIDALVIMDGDNRRGRTSAGIQVNAAASPREIWVLGDGTLIEELSAGGVPRNRILHNAFLETTRDQIASLAAIMARRPGWKVAVIVSRLQAARMARLIDGAHLAVTLIESPVDVEPPTTGAGSFVPTYYALRLSRDALYEHAALWYYRRRGWIS